jgi:16S rRNA (adenine1518-N6/adenine1519-N6)-dimethyltransferase
VRAKKSLGQNFLVDGNLQRKIVATLGAGASDRVLEIGPGRGALTRHLAGAVAHLTLVELDDGLAAALARRYRNRDDVTVIHDDFLRVPLAERVRDPDALLVVGNIPYNLTSPILFHLLERPRPARIVLMVQAEVAARIVAEPGGGDYGALAVGVASVAEARLGFSVPRTAFRPVPGVDSAVVEIVPHEPPHLTPDDEIRLRTLTRAAFQWRRKQMQKILRDHPDLAADRAALDEAAVDLGLDLVRRPETFAWTELLALARRLVSG